MLTFLKKEYIVKTTSYLNQKEMKFIFEVDLEFIKLTRTKKGYSLQKMVNLMGILDKTKYYRREKGQVHFRPEELRLIADILEVPLEYLFKREVSEKETDGVV